MVPAADHHLHADRRGAVAGDLFLLPAVIGRFHRARGHRRQINDISVAARVLAEFGDYLTEEQRVPDTWPNWAG